MKYAQISSGRKLHLVCEAGEEYRGQIIRKGFISAPLCGQKQQGYRMTISVPLNNACKKCMKIRRKQEAEK